MILQTTVLSRPPRSSFSLGWRGGMVFVLAVSFWARNAVALPRGPIPPHPESTPLCRVSWDEEYYLGQTNSELTIPGLGQLDESWSGYQLGRSDQSVVPFIISALDGSGN